MEIHRKAALPHAFLRHVGPGVFETAFLGSNLSRIEAPTGRHPEFRESTEPKRVELSLPNRLLGRDHRMRRHTHVYEIIHYPESWSRRLYELIAVIPFSRSR